MRYDNEAGKGDDKRVGAMETPYQFTRRDARPWLPKEA
jgi:hypothetical protein